MKAFGINGSTTDHGGTVVATQSRSSQMGSLFLRAGDGFACPKCKKWSTLIKSHDHVIFDGKAVAYVGDKFTCGATLIPKQVHVVGTSGGLSSLKGVNNQNPILNNSLVLAENQSTRIKNMAHYKWWWGKLESKNIETFVQEKRSFKENFDAMHKQYAYGKDDIRYEIDPKAWDVEVAFEDLPNAIQRSVDNNGDIGKAISKMSNGQSIDFEWKGLGFGQDYFRTIISKEWPLGRLACNAKGKLTKIGVDSRGLPNFQFVGYIQIKDDTYSWGADNNNLIKNLGIKVMGKAVEIATGKQTASTVYAATNYEMPTTYARKFHFDYLKDGTKTPMLSR